MPPPPRQHRQKSSIIYNDVVHATHLQYDLFLSILYFSATTKLTYFCKKLFVLHHTRTGMTVCYLFLFVFLLGKRLESSLWIITQTMTVLKETGKGLTAYIYNIMTF